MRTKLTLSIAAAALLAGGIAYAQAGPPHGMPMGDMTRADAEAHSAQAFARMDANKDGKLDEADRAARQKARFDRLDTDGNGSISREEFAARADHGRMGHGDGPGEGMPGMGHRGHDGPGGRGGRGMMAMMAKKADTNGDGAISQQEFTASAMTHFDQADANNDGKVTADERQAMHEKMRALRGTRTTG